MGADVCQWLRFGLDPFVYLTALEEAEIITGKHSDGFTNDHGRYIAVTPEQTLLSVGK
jgi:hypothetical protein